MENPSEFDRDVDDSMRLFQRANIGSAEPLPCIRPARVLAVMDGSDQDELCINTARELNETYNTETFFLDARDSPQQRQVDLGAAAAGKISGGRGILRPDGAAFDAILASLKTHHVDLVIVPCPFGRDFKQVGQDSVGTVMDVLLARCAVPILVLRREDQTFSIARRRVSVMVSAESDVGMRAASWALGLAADHAELSLNLVVEKEHFENVRSIVEAMHPDESLSAAQLGDVMVQTHQVLHAAISKSASERSLKYSLIPQAGELAPPNPLSDPKVQLLVMPLEVDDRFTQGFVQDRLRRSPHPVLVVPGHVPSS
ncbi:MAG: universal stress protein [Planctomycetota bacterium]